MEIELSPWPPQYTIRRSKRARRITLKISETRGLEVVLPMRMGEYHILSMLEQHRTWILTKLSKIKILDYQTLPTVIHLAMIDEQWEIIHDPRESHFVRVYPNQMTRTILLQGPTHSFDQFRQLIKKWLMREAKKYLSQMVDRLCEQHGFTYSRLSIRQAKTRWGSCSANKNISLNYKLLLMPRSYAEHIILHELCHTVHLNHSKQFWNLLKLVDPQAKFHHYATREFKNDLTLWLDYE